VDSATAAMQRRLEFGKWQFGAVAYGSSDLTLPIASYQKQNHFALGGLWGSVLMYAVIKISTNSRHFRPPLSWGSGL
jgi:hypothetical protein